MSAGGDNSGRPVDHECAAHDAVQGGFCSQRAQVLFAGAKLQCWEAQYKICNVDGGLLYTQRLSTNRWIAGLCDVSDEASAAACVERYCAAEPPQGSGGCPDENADAVPYSPPPPADDAGGSGGKSSKTGGATVAVVAVPAGLGLVLVAAAACYCYSRRRKPRPVAAKPLEVVHKEEAWRGPAQ